MNYRYQKQNFSNDCGGEYVDDGQVPSLEALWWLLKGLQTPNRGITTDASMNCFYIYMDR